MIYIYIILGLSLISALSIFSAVENYKKYQQMKIERDHAASIAERKYIKVSTALQNAVLEAYEQAAKNKNKFEVKKYQELLKEIKSKW